MAALTMSAHALPPEQHPGIDNNGNGISDIYERYYSYATDPNGDYDKDGVSNLKESIAGTNPGSSASFLTVRSVRFTGTAMETTWSTLRGKMYQLQAAPTLEGPWMNEGAALRGTGNPAYVNVPITGTSRYLRLEVSEVDTDNDGVSDWEEDQSGTNPLLYDSDGDGRGDRGLVEARMAALNMVDVYAVKSWASESGASPGLFRIVRRGGMRGLTVNFSLSGTATTGVDYSVAGGSAYFPAGATEAVVTVTPLNDSVLEPAETVTLTLTPASTFQMGSSTSATVTIVGNGIDGSYYNTAGSPYNLAENFAPAALAFTRQDSAVDFNWSKPAGTPAGTGTGVPDPRIVDDDLWSARWEGFIYPKTSELYQIHAIADRGVVVWVSTTPITAAPGTTTGARINQWSTTNPSTKYTANLLPNNVQTVAGQPLYFRVDYRDSAGSTNNANVQIRWSSASVPEEPIPASAYSSQGYPGGPPVITSPLGLTGIEGAPFSYQITATNSPTGYTASGLPAGLSIDAAGLISGTLGAAPGYYPVTISAANASGADARAAGRADVRR